MGAGIVGLTTDERLLTQGRSVLVLEARNVAGGVSGHTTAKVTAQHSLIYDRLTDRFGTAVARIYGEAQLRALDWIVGRAGDDGIDADLVIADSYVFSDAENDLDRFAREADVAAHAGMSPDYVTELDLPFPVAGTVRFTGQARFHPRKWLLGLADRIEGLGGQIIDGVRVTQVGEGDPMVVETSAGDVRAAEVVIATHYPILEQGLFFARLEPVRDLVVCGIPSPEAAHLRHMYLDVASQHSIRPIGGTDRTATGADRAGRTLPARRARGRPEEVRSIGGVGSGTTGN